MEIELLNPGERAHDRTEQVRHQNIEGKFRTKHKPWETPGIKEMSGPGFRTVFPGLAN